MVLSRRPRVGVGQESGRFPYVQEIAGLLVTKMPPEQAVAVAQRLGLDLSRCLLHREAHRQGIKAQARRSETLAQLDSWEDLQQLARDTEGPPAAPFTLVIEIDAWNIRERDDWGQTKARRKEGKKSNAGIGSIWLRSFAWTIGARRPASDRSLASAGTWPPAWVWRPSWPSFTGRPYNAA